MKTLIRNVALLVLGLSLAALSASAGAYNLSTSASNGNSDGNGGDPYVPAGAGAGWWAYAYGEASSWVQVSGNGLNAYVSSPYNGDDGGSGTTTSAGTLTIRMGCQTGPGGAAGAGVTVNW